MKEQFTLSIYGKPKIQQTQILEGNKIFLKSTFEFIIYYTSISPQIAKSPTTLDAINQNTAVS